MVKYNPPPPAATHYSGPQQLVQRSFQVSAGRICHFPSPTRTASRCKDLASWRGLTACQNQVPYLPNLPCYQHPGLLRVYSWVWSKLLGGLPKQYLFKIMYLSDDFWLHWVPLLPVSFLQLWWVGANSSLLFVAFPGQWLLLLRSTGFRNCGTLVLLLLGM